jgi:pyruvate/2-oxoglutarate dehydrogenase complex dihydrolipoamide acyltransferase (E2) component
MIKKVIMPVLGETMEEGTISKWRKQVGDHVEKGAVLLEVETDKAVLEVESFLNGYLRKIVVQERGTSKIGETIALIADTLEEPIEE